MTANLELLKKNSPNIYASIKKLQDSNRNAYISGIGCKELIEPIPLHNKASSEKVISGANNAQITLGRDRPSVKMSGYGGKGSPKSGMIDLVVGRMAYNPRQVDEEGNTLFAEPNFTTDASRIYISQRADIDEYMSLVAGKIGKSNDRSAIGLKSDSIRVVGRNGVKIVTGTDINDSNGNKINKIKGIDLIAGNDDSDLQPMVKGDDLNQCLEDMCDRMLDILAILRLTKDMYKKFFNEITNHNHYSPFFGKPTSPSDKLLISGNIISIFIDTLLEQQIKVVEQNIANLKSNYLRKGSSRDIRSNYNNAN